MKKLGLLAPITAKRRGTPFEHIHEGLRDIFPDFFSDRGKKLKSRSLPMPPVPPTKMPRIKNFAPIKCPCCSHTVSVPDLEIIIDYYKVPTCEERVLRAVWKGKGRPVQTERIFDSMYLDDPDGGPSPDAMYRAFKALMHNIRCRLVGSGITIESVGYRQGYRIVIGDGSNG